jgi:hypothetical protein
MLAVIIMGKCIVAYGKKKKEREEEERERVGRKRRRGKRKRRHEDVSESDMNPVLKVYKLESKIEYSYTLK